MSASERLRQIRIGGLVPRHVAVIMDGNGRWARQRGLPRHAGHKAGMRSVREAIEGAIEAGVEVLTLFAFSTENWQRPRPEISALMGLLRLYAHREKAELREQGVEVHVLGDLDQLDRGTRRAVDDIVRSTAGGDRLRLNLMISYSGREEILRACRRLAEEVATGARAAADVDEEAFEAHLFTAGVPDPDLLIRTSGEVRVSNFLLWQLAYTEMYITPVLWPDFDREELFEAILDFQRRERRFGRVSAV
ncbi:MAG: di-trans,poly-cis-decaprenylcistransferase [Gemmatimonadetes bacterium]|nr:MAG: di-trans,poly-cis-decaprenylcistransferase [Gemmatimonadota bacterium]